MVGRNLLMTTFIRLFKATSPKIPKVKKIRSKLSLIKKSLTNKPKAIPTVPPKKVKNLS